MPALPLHEAGKYVAGAYIVLFALVLIYVAIMATRLSRIERELGELLEITERSAPGDRTQADQSQVDAAKVSGAQTGGPQSTNPSVTEPDPLDVGRPRSTHV
jgi:hypothetical protein